MLYCIAENVSRMCKIEHFANQRKCPIFVNKNKTFADNTFANGYSRNS